MRKTNMTKILTKKKKIAQRCLYIKEQKIFK